MQLTSVSPITPPASSCQIWREVPSQPPKAVRRVCMSVGSVACATTAPLDGVGCSGEGCHPPVGKGGGEGNDGEEGGVMDIDPRSVKFHGNLSSENCGFRENLPTKHAMS